MLIKIIFAEYFNRLVYLLSIIEDQYLFGQ